MSRSCVFCLENHTCAVVVVVVDVPLKGGTQLQLLVDKWKSTTFTQLHNQGDR
jgi:hypothetical protein